jgi:hypothetical protein
MKLIKRVPEGHSIEHAFINWYRYDYYFRIILFWRLFGYKCSQTFRLRWMDVDKPCKFFIYFEKWKD